MSRPPFLALPVLCLTLRLVHSLAQRRGGKRPYRREPGDTEGGPEDMEVDDGPGAGQVGVGCRRGAGQGPNTGRTGCCVNAVTELPLADGTGALSTAFSRSAGCTLTFYLLTMR